MTDEDRADAICEELFAEFLRPPALLSVSAWADQNRMLSGKASSEPGKWRTDRTPYLRQIMDDLSATSEVQEVVLMFAAQLGKALALDTPIPTPTGWTTMGEIKPGQWVFGDAGEPVRVKAVSPVQHGRDCYRVTFSDGSDVVCDGDHLWTVDEYDHGAPVGERTATLNELVVSGIKQGSRNRFAVRVAGALQLPDAELPIDPYTLGVWLGLVGNKHVPDQYLRAGYEQRLALLQGLMDTDGHVTERGRCEFASSNKRLIDEVYELLMTLGIKSTIYERQTHDANGKQAKRGLFLTSYRLSFTCYADAPVFRLGRKLARLPLRESGREGEVNRRRIVSVEPVDSVPVRCIAVESERKLYLCGRSMIPTHNSETGNNWLGYIIDNEPGPVMCVQPTTDMAKRFSRQRIAPMLEETPILRKKVRENRSRDDANTTLMKDFAGGVLVVAGANSAAGLRSMPVRYLFLDEIDAYPLDVDGEGDPVSLAEKRTSTFARRKILRVSTPTIKGLSRIEAAYEASNACKYYVPCPHCGEHQVLEWGADKPHGLRWERRADGLPDLGTVRYICAHCGVEIEEHHKPLMLGHGEWRATRQAAKPGKVTGYQLNALYAPLGWVSWPDLVNQWAEAMTAVKSGDITRLKTYTNTVLAETWEEKGDGSDEHALQARAKAEGLPLGVVPPGGLVLTAGVDVQRNRWEVAIWAWGRGLESWVVDHQIIEGNPAAEDDWERLTDYLLSRWPSEAGTLGLSAVSIDSSDQTQDVYNWVRKAQRLIPTLRAVKGSSEGGKPILMPASLVEVNYKGQKIPNGLKLWGIGVDTAKDLLFGQLAIPSPGPGFVHMAADLPREWFEQLTAEHRVLQRVGGRDVYRWKKRRPRNEVLDCRNYALHAAMGLGLHNMPEARWAAMENKPTPKPVETPKPVQHFRRPPPSNTRVW